MANVDAAFGFRPVGNDGGVYTGQTQRCVFNTAATKDTFVGDPVKMDATDAVDGYAAVQIATAGAPVYGVVTSIEADPDNLSLQYRQSVTQRFCQVARADNTLFEVQEVANIGLAAVNGNIGYIVQAGSAFTGLSKTEITTPTANNTGDCQVVSGVNAVDNDLTASNARWIIKFNDPQGKPVRTGT